MGLKSGGDAKKPKRVIEYRSQNAVVQSFGINESIERSIKRKEQKIREVVSAATPAFVIG